jgi:hypothetical protein
MWYWTIKLPVYETSFSNVKFGYLTLAYDNNNDHNRDSSTFIFRLYSIHQHTYNINLTLWFAQADRCISVSQFIEQIMTILINVQHASSATCKEILKIDCQVFFLLVKSHDSVQNDSSFHMNILQETTMHAPIYVYFILAEMKELYKYLKK